MEIVRLSLCRITAVAPFVGYLQDLVGRREITLVGSVIIMVGIVLVATAHTFGQAVTGMALSGAGAGICELTALAGFVAVIPHTTSNRLLTTQFPVFRISFQ